MKPAAIRFKRLCSILFYSMCRLRLTCYGIGLLLACLLVRGIDF